MKHAYRLRRIMLVVGLLIVMAIPISQQVSLPTPHNHSSSSSTKMSLDQLDTLAVKGRAPKTGYDRMQFGGEWASEGTCTMRDQILARDLTEVVYEPNTCEVKSGVLDDPYTGKVIHFQRGPKTSAMIQIDHVVAIGDAWQTGAQQLTLDERKQMYNDPLELLAVDGAANQQKSDGDAATWLPPNKSFRCQYVSRQIQVKVKYHLWVTSAEKQAIGDILSSC